NRMLGGIVITLFFFIHTCAYASILRHCEPVNETISVEKEECPKCVLITTRICSGYCLTRVSETFTIAPLYQHVCSYKEIRYEKIKLPGCPNGVDPYFTYPVAVSCYCSLCKMDNSDSCLGEVALCKISSFLLSSLSPQPRQLPVFLYTRIKTSD
uniref:Luteinizing hormone subunit beta n=1 Tax=Erpetoichthys calabaricus TaxID=27687 RepID=A0A8C4TPL5_ERPCA